MAWALMGLAGRVWAYEVGPPSEALICLLARQADEAVAPNMLLAPSSGSTVTIGTPVTFSAKTERPVTFELASSEALLSSPDIDSTMGSPSGAFFTFTSTSATASARTIYWQTSFTTTPEDCKEQSTFTSSVHTLIVAQSEAELAATKKMQEEAAARKSAEEAAAAKKKQEEEAARGSVALDGLVIDIGRRGEAAVELTCSDVENCVGELRLTATVHYGKGKVRHARTERIGVGNFAIAADKQIMGEVALVKDIRTLLSAAHGNLHASLTIRRTSPLPIDTQVKNVRLDAHR
jgi:hypothetical protein